MAPSCEFVRKNNCNEKLSQLIQQTESCVTRRKTFIPSESDFILKMQFETCVSIKMLRKGIANLKAKCRGALDNSTQTIQILRRRLAASNRELERKDNQIRSLHENLRNLSLRLECSICLDRQITMVTECGHVFCAICCVNMTICGLCRGITGPCRPIFVWTFDFTSFCIELIIESKFNNH